MTVKEKMIEMIEKLNDEQIFELMACVAFKEDEIGAYPLDEEFVNYCKDYPNLEYEYKYGKNN